MSFSAAIANKSRLIFICAQQNATTFIHLPARHQQQQYSTATNLKVPENVPEPVLSSTNTAQFKKGTGGRASFSGNVITVFGATGFTGLGIVNRLAKQGNQLIIPYRSDPYFVKEHKVSGELGQILFFPFQLNDEDSIRRAVKYSNVVVNLIGSFVDTPNYSIAQTNVNGCQRIARICREMGVERLVHVSALGADPNHVSRYKKNGQFLKTKGLGELAVREEFPSATIVRPSVIFGEKDLFIFFMLSSLRRMPALGWVYVYKGGRGIYKMPTFVNDFNFGISRITMDPSMAGKTFELVGPHCYELCELVDYMYRKAGCHPDIVTFYRRNSWPDPWFYLWSGLCVLSRKVYRQNRAYINWEWLDFVEATSDVLTGGSTLGFKDLGIKPQEFENVGGKWCFIWSFSRALELQYGDYIEPPLPLRSPPLYKSPKGKAAVKQQIHTEQRTFSLG